MEQFERVVGQDCIIVMSQKRSRWDSSDDEDDQKAERDSIRPKIESEAPVITDTTNGDLDVDDARDKKVDGDNEDNGESRSPCSNVATDCVEASTNDALQGGHYPLFHGCRSVDEYRRLNFIDQGTYGMVFRAECLATGETVALKQVKMTRNDQKVGFPITALRETNILLALRHPNM